MSQYVGTLLLLLPALFVMIYMSATNEYIDKTVKTGFTVAFFSVALSLSAEYLTAALGGDQRFRVLQIALNFARLYLAPAAFLIFGASVRKFRNLRPAICVFAAYAVMLTVLALSGKLFTVDASCVFHRGDMFWFCALSYPAGALYLFAESWRITKSGFLRDKIFLITLYAFFNLCILIQAVNPGIHIIRIAVAVSSVIYYAYYNEINNLYDGLTGLLSQNIYCKKLKRLKNGSILVIIDVDEFKLVNDNHGHFYGDRALISISEIIRSIYSQFGSCYRIGGDEFAVIIDIKCDIDRLNNAFRRCLSEGAKRDSNLPTVSLGYAVFENTLTVPEVVEHADFMMYEVKKSKSIIPTGSTSGFRN